MLVFIGRVSYEVAPMTYVKEAITRQTCIVCVQRDKAGIIFDGLMERVFHHLFGRLRPHESYAILSSKTS